MLTAAAWAFGTGTLRRRTQYLSAFVSMTICFSIWTAVSAKYAESGGNSAAIAVIAFIFIYNACYNIMQPLTYVYVTEVFPFVHRAKGVAILQFFTRGSTAFNSFVNPIGLDSIHWKYYLVYIVGCLACAHGALFLTSIQVWLCVETTVIYFLYPETQGPTLEEISRGKYR
jgi:hypothetical protein